MLDRILHLYSEALTRDLGLESKEAESHLYKRATNSPPSLPPSLALNLHKKQPSHIGLIYLVHKGNSVCGGE